jgi:hypothetical protein
LFLSSAPSQPYFISNFSILGRSFFEPIKVWKDVNFVGIHLNSNFEATDFTARYCGTRGHSSATQLSPILAPTTPARAPPTTTVARPLPARASPPSRGRAPTSLRPPCGCPHRLAPLLCSPPCLYKRATTSSLPLLFSPFSSFVSHGHIVTPLLTSCPPPTVEVSPPSQNRSHRHRFIQRTVTLPFGHRCPPLSIPPHSPWPLMP